jgi:hypothetical protein
MQQFLNSYPVSSDAGALRERAARDGYLFFRGLIPPEPLLEVRRQILAVCERHGFLAEGASREEGIARPGVRWREGDAPYMAAYDEIQRLEVFHALAHQSPLLAVLRRLLGEEVLVHPRNIARVMVPQNNPFKTPAHQDYIHIQGTEMTYTAWIPLGDCPRALGGLEVLVGSHRLGLQPVHAAPGAGGVGIATDELGLPWAGGSFRCGDVLLFHSLCIHRGSDNRTRDRVRLSVDYRYQGASQPVTAYSLLPHFNRLPWDEIYRGWKDPSLQFYWQRFPLQMAEFTREYYAAARR